MIIGHKKLYILLHIICYSACIMSMENPKQTLFSFIFEQLKNDVYNNKNINLESLSEKLLKEYEEGGKKLSPILLDAIDGNLFLKHIEIAKLYKTLIGLQKNPPIGHYPKQISADAFSPKIERAWTAFSYNNFFNRATIIGLNASYKEILMPTTREDSMFFSNFIKPEHLQWIAYLQNKHGTNNPFTYDSTNAGSDSWNNPVLGTYTTQDGKILTITRYGFLIGLLNPLSIITKKEQTNFLFKYNINALIANLQIAIEHAKNNNKPNSKIYKGLYLSLCNQEQQPPTQNTQNESQEVFETFNQTFFTYAQKSGLIVMYKNLLFSESTDQKKLFDTLIAPGNLEWTAYLQWKHTGDCIHPFNFNSSDVGTDKWNNPVLGYYTTKENQQITITRYSFLYGLLNAIDDITQDEWNNEYKIIDANLEKLYKNLEQAIQNAKNKPVEKPSVTPQKEIEKIISSVKPNERDQEIESLIFKLKQDNKSFIDVLAEQYINKIAYNEPKEDTKREDKASEVKLYIKDKLQNHILTKSELNLTDIGEQIRTLKIIYRGKTTGPFYENLVKLFTEQKTTKLTCHPMLAGGIGDALGRVTEFIKSTKGIFNKYTNGVLTYDDFQSNDWNNIPEALQKNRIAPYTDDTRMAILVMEALLESNKQSLNLEDTMSLIANKFIEDSNNNELGWIAPFRAPGGAVEKNISIIRQSSKTQKEWWDAQGYRDGGCGSVMRAHPFGIVFARDPKKAEEWAAEHSKITHGHPMALAACAAMAAGVANALQKKPWNQVFDSMIAAAEKYENQNPQVQDVNRPKTSAKIKDALFESKVSKHYYSGDIVDDLQKNENMRAQHEKVFTKFEGWTADDAIAATVYSVALALESKKINKIMEAIYIGVHTPGDSDSIASMAGALIAAGICDEELPEELVEKLEDTEKLQKYDETIPQ